MSDKKNRQQVLLGLKNFIKRYKWCSLGIPAGIFAGFWGVVAGLGAGVFLSLILSRKAEDEAIRKKLENPNSCESNGNGVNVFSKNKNSTGMPYKDEVLEPFPNAIIISALAVFCYKDADIAACQMRICFSGICNNPVVDWETLCRPALYTNALNGDLLVECLASSLKKLENSDLKKSLIERVFKMLGAAELGWKEKDRGTPPSCYLSELLHYKRVSDDVLSACLVLGVKPDDGESVIKDSYRKLIRIYHPDTVQSLSMEQQQCASEMFIRIRKAYEVMSLNMQN